ncbi:membrane protein [Sphaerisporangium krabiense]|uniref:DUF2029 domain-containing protein n=1 Tax=Sphaerisporangium krabiense TaxID=763782 RepID=A0A7W8YZ65_9ACTN|nr:glycosyltransferase family 87 protein [Sphaerisporangium krabiense]MBB5624507.1 hypothetical protein [Sphaerisporangium krabiense]GII61538.1 membrane protein [Sphaerisporangium krabiense]
MRDEADPRRARPGTALTVPGLWLATRAFLLLTVLDIVPLFRTVTWDVTGVYHGWHETMLGGSFPVDDVTWQYPPAAALIIMAPSMLPFSYLGGFLVITVAFDALTMASLMRVPAGEEGRTHVGAWIWLAGVPLLGPVVYARYDLLVTALAVSGLLQLRASSARGGLALGVAAGLKLWPALALIGTPRGRETRRTLAGAAVGGAVSTLLMMTALDGGLGFLTAQQDRGVEVESVWALAFHVARWFGWPGMVSYSYGSMEMIGPYAEAADRVSLAATLLGLCWLVLWRRRARAWTAATPYDAALAAVLIFVVTSRVISPQYLVWLVGLAAVCLTVRASTQRPVAALVLAATAVTMLEFPPLFEDVQQSTVLGVTVLVVRNGLLVAATAVSCLRLWRATVPGAVTARPRDPGLATA